MSKYTAESPYRNKLRRACRSDNRKYILYKFELRRGAEDGDEQPREAVQGGGGQQGDHHTRTAWGLELEMKVMRSLAKISITERDAIFIRDLTSTYHTMG